MTTDRNQKYQDIASRTKYHRLYRHLCNLPFREWENDIPGNRVDHRLRATCVRTYSPALVGKPEGYQRTQPGSCMERRRMGNGRS